MTRTTLLGDLVNIKSGKSRPKETGEFSVYGGNGIFDSAPTANINEPAIIIGRVGAYCGSVYIEKNPFWLSDNALGVTARDDNDLDFIYYLLKSLNLNNRSIGGAQPLLTQGILKNILVTIPEDEKMQKKIANILVVLDEKIELNRRMNETLEQMGRTLFRHYFIDNPEAEKWGSQIIGRLCSVKIGRTPPRKESQWFDRNHGEAWVSIKDMGHSSTFISDSSEYLTKEAAAKFNIPVIEPNTLLLSFKLTVGRLCISTKRMHSNEAIAQLPIRSDKINLEYLYYFLRNFNFDQLSSTSSIATAVNSTTVKNMPVIIPNRATLVDFTERARANLEMIRDNERQIQTLTALRDTLLPQLMSGKIKIDGLD